MCFSCINISGRLSAVRLSLIVLGLICNLPTEVTILANYCWFDVHNFTVKHLAKYRCPGSSVHHAHVLCGIAVNPSNSSGSSMWQSGFQVLLITMLACKSSCTIMGHRYYRLLNQDWKQLKCSNSDSRFCHGTSWLRFFAKFCALFSPKEYVEDSLE